MCVQVPCVYILHTASAVTVRNTYYTYGQATEGMISAEVLSLVNDRCATVLESVETT